MKRMTLVVLLLVINQTSKLERKRFQQVLVNPSIKRLRVSQLEHIRNQLLTKLSKKILSTRESMTLETDFMQLRYLSVKLMT